MREDKACSPEDGVEIRRQVQAFDVASAAKRLREEKTGAMVLQGLRGKQPTERLGAT
jgi:hypothetical protein